jgi:hypothetical protein
MKKIDKKSTISESKNIKKQMLKNGVSGGGFCIYK